MVTRETEAEKRYGIGRSLVPLTHELKRRGIAVDYICQSDLGVRSKSFIQKLYHRLGASGLRNKGQTDLPLLLYIIVERFNMGRLAAKLAAQEKYTHVHCHDPIIAAGFRFFSMCRTSAKIKWGVTEHGFGSYARAIYEDGIRMGTIAMRLMKRWEARILRKADWVVAPTHSALQLVAEDLGIEPIPANWRMIHHARPTVKRYARREAREKLGWDPHLFYVLAVGRIAPVKQFPLLVEACARLQNAENLQLAILGEGETAELSELGKRSGLAKDIVFTTTDDVGLYLSAADLYVSTSVSESFGLANLEAMTAGLASICTAVGGVPEVAGDGAILIRPELDELVQAMQRMIDDEALRNATARKGSARAEAWPTINDIADAYETIYR